MRLQKSKNEETQSEDDKIPNEIETAAGLMKAKEADDASDVAAHNLGEDANAAAAVKSKSEK